MKVAIIGGGAAGFFAAFSVKEHHPTAEVTIFEKSDKLLSKVKISGGGRCNVTHACFKPSLLSKFYPRGEKQLKKAFSVFQPKDTVEWFAKRGVSLKAEIDNRMFPDTNNSQTIIDCFLKEARTKDIKIVKNNAVSSFESNDKGIYLNFKTGNQQFDKVVLATGGSPKMRGFEWLEKTGHTIVEPLPSLFTFNMPKESITELMGLVVENATVRIQATKLQYSGPVLVTHWGMSGPAILKLSAWGARLLFKKSYQFNIQINWLSIKNEEEVNSILIEKESSIRKKKIANANPFTLPNRMWVYLLERVQINPDLPWFELSKKNKNKLINVLLNDVYEVCGKTTFKEEFVTSGGVSLEDVNFSTMESLKCKNLYFAGELLNIDGITGGFNFQAAWTTGFIAGKLN
jgi:predicted Rossmann fold flavoprotein